MENSEASMSFPKVLVVDVGVRTRRCVRMYQCRYVPVYVSVCACVRVYMSKQKEGRRLVCFPSFLSRCLCWM